MYYLDKVRDQDGSRFYRTGSFRYPLEQKRSGQYRIQSGETIRVCMTSDFFYEEADACREQAWDMMRFRSDVIFYLLTKRPERVRECLPKDWGEGWENIFFNVTCENQKRADERIPILMDLPFRHKGIMCAPLIGPVKLGACLDSKEIEQVMAGGENYDGNRPCDFDWVRSLNEECVRADVTFVFIETGTVFIKDGKTYRLRGKKLQSEMAFKSGMYHPGKKQKFILRDAFGNEIPEDELYVPHYRSSCAMCAMKPVCNGCSDCGKCR